LQNVVGGKIKKCVFYHHDETIKYLFFPIQRYKIYMVSHPNSFYLVSPSSVANIFGNWLVLIICLEFI
jgi:hypothetical protein